MNIMYLKARKALQTVASREGIPVALVIQSIEDAIHAAYSKAQTAHDCTALAAW